MVMSNKNKVKHSKKEEEQANKVIKIICHNVDGRIF